MEDFFKKYNHISRISVKKIYPLLKTFVKDRKITTGNCFACVPTDDSLKVAKDTILFAWKEKTNIQKHRYFVASKSLDELYSIVKYSETL